MEGLHSDPRGLGPEWCPGPRPYSAHPYPWRTSRVLWGRWPRAGRGTHLTCRVGVGGAQAWRGRKLASWVPDLASLGLHCLIYQMAVEDKSEQVNCLQQRRRHSPQKISRVSLLLLPVTALTFLSSQCRQGLSASSAPARELSGHRALVPLVCGGAPVHSGHHSCWDVASAPSSGAAFRWGGAVPGLVR